jgi:hypothetical protein
MIPFNSMHLGAYDTINLHFSNKKREKMLKATNALEDCGAEQQD